MAFTLLTPFRCHAEDCPWLNEATAQGLLGGPVALNLQHVSQTEESCTFSRMDDPQLTLIVEMSKLPDALQATPATTKGCHELHAMVGVGNAATACTLPAAHGIVTELATGRVRDQIFTVRWTLKASRSTTAAQREAELERVAEAIAGNLF